jgi:hypothetical protein
MLGILVSCLLDIIFSAEIHVASFSCNDGNGLVSSQHYPPFCVRHEFKVSVAFLIALENRFR